MEIDYTKSVLTAPDGTIFQVLNEEGTEWNEEETIKLLNDYINKNALS